MSRSPEEQAIFDSVYEDRRKFLKEYPKTVAVLTLWVATIEQQPTPEEMRLRVHQEATHKAYEDELKRLLLLDLITE